MNLLSRGKLAKQRVTITKRYLMPVSKDATITTKSAQHEHPMLYTLSSSSNNATQYVAVLQKYTRNRAKVKDIQLRNWLVSLLKGCPRVAF